MARRVDVPAFHWPARGLIVRVGARREFAEPMHTADARNDRLKAEKLEAEKLEAERREYERREYDWLEYDGARVLGEGRARAGDLPAARAVVLLLAAEDVLLTRAIVPPLTGQRLREALPYLVEERTLAEPSALHVALGRAAGDQHALAVVDRAWMRTVLERFGNCKIVAVLPEALCVPLVPPAWTLVREPDEGPGAGRGNGQGQQDSVVRNSADQDSADRNSEAPNLHSWVRQDVDLAIALPHAAEAARATLQLLVAQVPAAQQPVRINGFGQVGIFDSGQLRVQGFAGRALNTWIEQGGPADRAAAPPTLLQHEFSGSARGANLLSNWRRAALLLLLLALVQIGGMQLRWHQLRAEHASLQAEAASALQSVFPETTVVLDATLQMARGLAQLRAATGRADPGDFAAMMGVAGQIFAEAPVASVRSLDYAERSARLQFLVEPLNDEAARATATERARQAGYELRFEGAGSVSGDAAAASGTGNAGTIAILRVRTSS